jgi:hypothetical protein
MEEPMDGATAFDLRYLRDRREIQDLALRYARAADRRDYALFEAIFSEDARLSGHRGDPDTTPPYFVLEGRDTIVASMRALERFESTLHVVSNQLVEVDEDRAHGETYCTAHHIYRDGGVAMNHTMAIRYHDRLVRTNGRWRFRQRRLAVDWERHAPLREDGPAADAHPSDPDTRRE